MEHYRSTLGTAAVAAAGLFVAARVLHPGNFEDTPRAPRPVPVEAAVPSTTVAARIDPPYGLYMRPSAASSEMAVLAPRLTAPLPAGMAMMPVLPAGMTTVTDGPRESGMQPRRKAVSPSVRAKPTQARTAQAASPDAPSPMAGTPDLMSRDRDPDDEGCPPCSLARRT